jgi:predicted MFS family arabinose efflux permease
LILVGVLTDRLGKKLSLGLGLGISLLAALGLPFLKYNLSLTVGALFVYYLAFEFALVTGLSLVSELRPAARATLMAFNAAAVSAGDALGTFLGPRLFKGSIAPNVTALVILNAAALLVLVLFVRDDARG